MKADTEYKKAIEQFTEQQAKTALLEVVKKIKNNCTIDTVDLFKILILDLKNE